MVVAEILQTECLALAELNIAFFWQKENKTSLDISYIYRSLPLLA